MQLPFPSAITAEKKTKKSKGSSRNLGFIKNCLDLPNQKKPKNLSVATEKNPEEHSDLEKNEKKIEDFVSKMDQKAIFRKTLPKTVGTFARLELRGQVFTCSSSV